MGRIQIYALKVLSRDRYSRFLHAVNICLYDRDLMTVGLRNEKRRCNDSNKSNVIVMLTRILLLMFTVDIVSTSVCYS